MRTLGPRESRQECDFCAIVDNVKPAIRIFESESVLSFLPLAPVTTGHTLVIPKVHVEDMWEIDEREMSNVMAASLLIAHAIRDSLAPDGLNVINSSGAAASQTVPHLHVHLVPRWQGDRIGDIWPASPTWEESELDDMATLIRAKING
ncbi:HIT family protein [Streptomyces sp. NPDC058855]|uniref:HIT family protein n=1 Tax=Streptomyces sp. NPDC058855 TaxID=3346651 RepID=UPI0036A08C73